MIRRIPGEGRDVEIEAVSVSFISFIGHLEKKRKSITDSAPKGKKKNKFEIVARKNICCELNLYSNEENLTSYSLGKDRNSDRDYIYDESGDNGSFLEQDGPEKCENQLLRYFKKFCRREI